LSRFTVQKIPNKKFIGRPRRSRSFSRALSFGLSQESSAASLSLSVGEVWCLVAQSVGSVAEQDIARERLKRCQSGLAELPQSFIEKRNDLHRTAGRQQGTQRPRSWRSPRSQIAEDLEFTARHDCTATPAGGRRGGCSWMFLFTAAGSRRFHNRQDCEMRPCHVR
jgi:hypothetical protein